MFGGRRRGASGAARDERNCRRERFMGDMGKYILNRRSKDDRIWREET